MGRIINYETPTILTDQKTGRQYREIIKRGAARNSVRGSKNIRALVGHEKNKILGRTDKKSLELREDEFGVEVVSLKIPKTQLGEDTRNDIENGNLDGWSFGMPPSSIKEKWVRSPDGMPTREIYELELSEVSLTSVASYPNTYAEVRDVSFPEKIIDPPDHELMTIRLIEKMIECDT